MVSDGYSADGADAALVALVVDGLAAIAEDLAPGVRGVAGVLCTGPVPAGEGILAVGDQKGLLLAGRQGAARFFSPCHGVVPAQALGGLLRYQDDVMAERTVFVEDNAGVTFVFLKFRDVHDFFSMYSVRGFIMASMTALASFFLR